MPAVKNVGEPCAGEPHARFDAAAGGNQTSRASTCRAVQAPLADPTARHSALDEDRVPRIQRQHCRSLPGIRKIGPLWRCDPDPDPGADGLKVAKVLANRPGSRRRKRSSAASEDAAVRAWQQRRPASNCGSIPVVASRKPAPARSFDRSTSTAGWTCSAVYPNARLRLPAILELAPLDG